MISVIAGLLPAIILVGYIYYADRLQREPLRQMFRAFMFGVASIAVSLCFTVILELVGLDGETMPGLLGALSGAFWGAAIPEECAKLLMLWLVVRKNKYFDEKMDGIVYAVCVGMGFAGLENIMYIDSAGSDWLTLVVMRGLMSVPGHYYDAVFMGYYFSLYWFESRNRAYHLLMALATPIFAHGLYDFLLMYLSGIDSPVLIMILFAVLIYSCIQFYKWSKKRISQHIESDGRDKDGYNRSER